MSTDFLPLGSRSGRRDDPDRHRTAPEPALEDGDRDAGPGSAGDLGSADDGRPGVDGGQPRMELETGAMAAGGGCVARADDGRVVFVRHALPGERVVAEVTAVTTSFLRADAVEVLDASVDRVAPPCPHAGPGRCGGCDWQHVDPPRPTSSQGRAGRRTAAPAGRQSTAVWWSKRSPVPPTDWAGGPGSASPSTGREGSGCTDTAPTTSSRWSTVPIVTAEVDRAVAGTVDCGRGAHQVEVTASPDGGHRCWPSRPAGVDWRPAGRRRRRAGGERPDRRPPDRSQFKVLGPALRGRCRGVLAGAPGGRGPAHRVRHRQDSARDGASGSPTSTPGPGLFTVALAHAVGPRGRVVAVERNRRACADRGSQRRRIDPGRDRPMPRSTPPPVTGNRERRGPGGARPGSARAPGCR